MSIKFILMFFVNPFQVLRNLTSEYVESDEVFNDCAPVTFLRQEFLRDELSAFLERHGYEPSEIALVRQMSPVNASEPIAGYGRDELRAEAERYTRDRERLIYRVLERRGILYPP